MVNFWEKYRKIGIFGWFGILGCFFFVGGDEGWEGMFTVFFL